MSDSYIRAQGLIYFFQEAPDLLQTIEQELLQLPEEHTTAKVHNLMRATHTLKGSAANVGFELIQHIAHSLEDVVKSLYNLEIEITANLQSLLYSVYECLQECLNAAIQELPLDEAEMLERTEVIFQQLTEELGDFLTTETHIPSSEELGFDLVESLFKIGVQERISNIEEALCFASPEELLSILTDAVSVLIGLAESLNLAGFLELTQTIDQAINTSPDQVVEIAKLAVQDLHKIQEAVLSGDRECQGFISAQLLAYTTTELCSVPDNNFSLEIGESLIYSDSQTQAELSQGEIIKIDHSLPSINLETELKEYTEFLLSDRFLVNKPLSIDAGDYYIKITKLCLQWWQELQNLPEEELTLNLLVPKYAANTSEESTTETAYKYIDNWLTHLLETITKPTDSDTLIYYRHASILQVILSIAQYLYLPSDAQKDDRLNDPLLQKIYQELKQIIRIYKQQIPITSQEKQWIDHVELNTNQFAVSDINLEIDANEIMTNIWGQPNTIITPEIESNLTIHQPVTITEVTEVKVEVEELKVKDVTPAPEKNHSPTPISTNVPFIKIELPEIQNLNHLAGNLLINQNRQLLQTENLQQEISQIRHYLQVQQQTINLLEELARNRVNQIDPHDSSTIHEQFDLLELDKYNEINGCIHKLNAHVEQLTTSLSSLEQTEQKLKFALEKQQRLLTHLRDDLTTIQMSPLEQIWQRFPALIQQLSRSQNKPIELICSGGEVLIDKAIVDQLYTPLLHLIRNAFDHGIESAETRISQGKAAIGQISLNAYHQGNQTVIEIKDDGKGIDFNAIKNQAIKNGLISEYDANNLSQEQLLQFIFTPGFSTAQSVTGISGRGIGLDIVSHQIELMKGSINISSQPGFGTTFYLKIPFHMTSTKLFICETAGFKYALAADSISKIILATDQQIQSSGNQEVLIYGESSNSQIPQQSSAIPLYRLSNLIQYNPNFVYQNHLINEYKSTPENKGFTQVLLINDQQNTYALAVDQVYGEQELVIRPLHSVITAPDYLFGYSSLGDGKLILAIDSINLINQNNHVKMSSIAAISPNSQRQLPPVNHQLTLSPSPQSITNILVVEDSLSYRQTLTLTLEKHSYKVYQAADGLAALEQLQLHPDINIIISDIEMPRLNGFELLQRKSQYPEINHIPVIMLTSRNSDKHRLLVTQLGANEYFTKPYNEEELIKTIESLVNKSLTITH